MLELSKKIFFLGKKLHLKELHPFHLGIVMGIYNLFFIDLFSLIVFSAPAGKPVWFYVLFSAPVIFLLFWLWATQVILSAYKRVALYDALLIAKWSSWPFVALMIIAGAFFVLSSQNASLPSQWIVMSYYTLFSSMLLVVLNFVVVTVGLRHPFNR